MIDARTLEAILSDQKAELEARQQETLCHRPEESLVEKLTCRHKKSPRFYGSRGWGEGENVCLFVQAVSV